MFLCRFVTVGLLSRDWNGAGGRRRWGGVERTLSFGVAGDGDWSEFYTREKINTINKKKKEKKKVVED